MNHEITARINHRSGYNCAQAVTVAFAEELHTTDKDHAGRSQATLGGREVRRISGRIGSPERAEAGGGQCVHGEVFG